MSQKVIIICIVLFFVGLFLSPFPVLAAACPVTDGGVGDGDATVNGVITISANTTWTGDVTNQGDFDCSDLDVNVSTSGVTLTLRPYDNNDTNYTNDYGITLRARNITVATGALISSDNLGYQNTKGPGVGPNGCPDNGSGGSYGGRGGKGCNSQSNPVDSVFTPTSLGSGGGNGNMTYSRRGGFGGGYMKFIVTDTMSISGTITANGEAGTQSGAGGSGGAIWIDTSVINGSGTIRTNGGNATGTAGTGGGGRIAIYYNSGSFPLNNMTNVQSRSGVGGGVLGGPGTIYIEQKGVDTAQQGKLYIGNNNSNGEYAGLLSGSYAFSLINLTQQGKLEVMGAESNLTIDDSNKITGDATRPYLLIDGTFTYTGASQYEINGYSLVNNGQLAGITDMRIGNSVAGGLYLFAKTWYHNSTQQYSFNDVTVDTNGLVTLDPYDDGDTDYTEDYGVTLNTHDLTINTSGSIISDYLGYLNVMGPGAGVNGASDNGSGASYGGKGGSGVYAAMDAVGTIYDTNWLGSGGGNGNMQYQRRGGYGGGAFTLNSTGTFTNNGTVSSNGEAGVGSGGGGAGGGITIRANVLNGTGIVRANGGSATGTAGSGSGGRIGIYKGSGTFDLNTKVQVSPGAQSGVQQGEKGTLAVSKVPTIPASLSQLKADATTVIATGAFTNETEVNLRSTISDSDPSDTLYSQFEVRPTNTSFFGSSTHVSTASNFSGIGIEKTASLSANASWYNSSWTKRKLITITNRTPNILNDYQVRLTIPYDTDMKADYGDLRFTNYFGSELNYFVESYDASNAIVWVKLDYLMSNGVSNIYLYYGNASATTTSNAAQTFTFYDDFSGESIDASKWSITNPSSWSIVNGELKVTSTTGRLTSTPAFNNGVVLETKYRYTTMASNGYMVGGFRTSTSNGFGYLQANTNDSYRNNGSWTTFNGQAPINTNLLMKINSTWSATTDIYVTNLDTQAAVKSVANISNSIDNENIVLGTRYDDANQGQAYVAYWDWIRVRKYSFIDPTIALGNEEDYYPFTLSDQTNYHWQTRTCDYFYNCSNWVSYGANAESATDFQIFLNVAPVSPISLGPSLLVTSGYSNNARPTLSFILDDPDLLDQVQYEIQISSTPDFLSPIIDFVSFLGLQGANSFTVGQSGGGIYLSGFPNQTLQEGGYYWRVKTIDAGAAQSSYTTASQGNYAFIVDTSGPVTNASDVLVSSVNGRGWVNVKPTINWTGSTDSFIKGYCLSVSEGSPSALPNVDPANNADLLSGLSGDITDPNCPYVVSGLSASLSAAPLVSGKNYYVSIKALDLAGNTYSGPDFQNLVSFMYDGTPPQNANPLSYPGTSFSSVNDMYFSWFTTGNNSASDSHSGLLGYQYAIADNVDENTVWKGTSEDPLTGTRIILPDNSESIQTHNLSSTDLSDLVVGENNVFFRAVDNAGNPASVYSKAILIYGGEAPSFLQDASLVVTPGTNTANEYSFAWSPASPSAGRTISNYYYMVNVPPPGTLATILDNSATYISTTANSVATRSLPNIHRGSNTLYVVVVDDNDNYSPSSYLRAYFTLNSSNPDSPLNLAASDASLKASSLWRASLAWSEPVYKGTGDLSYLIQRSSNGISWSNIATTSGTAYVDTVPTSTKFYWRVGSYDTSDISKATPSFTNGVSLIPKGSYLVPPDLSSGPTVSNITTKKAKISWSTSRSADSKVAYGTEPGKYNTEEVSSSIPVTDHTINLTNLLPGTKYYYVTKWTDEDGNNGISAEKNFTTSPAPSISSVAESDISLYSALISFTVKDANKATLLFGKTTTYGGSLTTNTSTAETTYSLKLEDLQDGTPYHYKLKLQDSEGDTYEFEDHVFTTLPRPKISNVQIQQVANTAQSTLYITWITNTEISSIVSYYPEDKPGMLRDEVNVALTKDKHQTILRGLLPDTTYILSIKGRDKMGNEGTSDLIRFTTATDTRPPEIFDLKIEPGELNQTTDSETTSQLIVSWNTDEPSTSQIEFGEGTGIDYPQKTQEDSNLTVNHMVVISNLTPSKVYHLRAVSKDKAENIGRSIDNVTITPKLTDSAVDLVITNLQNAFGFLGGFK